MAVYDESEGKGQMTEEWVISLSKGEMTVTRHGSSFVEPLKMLTHRDRDWAVEAMTNAWAEIAYGLRPRLNLSRSGSHPVTLKLTCCSLVETRINEKH